MKRKFFLITTAAITILLAGCEQFNSNLQNLNNSLSGINGGKPQYVNSIQNKWGVSNSDAMAWLTHDSEGWSNHGKLRGVNWYTYWSQQIHAKTTLSQEAYQYCHVNAWDNKKPGSNCEVFFQAYSMTNSEEMLTPNQ